MRDRDCAELVKDARYCSISGDCAFCNRKGRAENWRLCQDGLLKDTADAIEELQNLIAEVGKMMDELIAYAQKNADESREAEQRHYGSDSTVNVYTWMHNVKCVHERYVAMLDDIAAKLPEPPKED